MDLRDKVCLVTGAARRVGRVIALELARRGARVVVHYHTSHAEALEVAAECTRLSGGREALALACDQADTEAIDRLVAEVETLCGRVDVLVNNASVFRAMSFLDMTRAQWDTLLAVNLRGPAWFCRAVARGMVVRGSGVIVNVADAMADQPTPPFVPYGATKGALVSLTRGLAQELAPAVRVNAVGPGTVLLPESASDDLRGRAARCSVLGRVGTPEDVAAACVFLIEGSDYITGTFLAVDGGRVVQHP
ncbi:MAG TPA: SDR family oxidoreductase [Candidatus Sumerlaeota bacterium]|nr:SDR family oxidoreductase [Candidatus Sumerlaeota bacterium]